MVCCEILGASIFLPLNVLEDPLDAVKKFRK
jgi:hypothetical protein